jgi:hypothetical protein
MHLVVVVKLGAALLKMQNPIETCILNRRRKMHAPSHNPNPGALVVAKQASEKVYRVELDKTRRQSWRYSWEKVAGALVHAVAYLCGADVAGAFF